MQQVQWENSIIQGKCDRVKWEEKGTFVYHLFLTGTAKKELKIIVWVRIRIGIQIRTIMHGENGERSGCFKAMWINFAPAPPFPQEKKVIATPD